MKKRQHYCNVYYSYFHIMNSFVGLVALIKACFISSGLEISCGKALQGRMLTYLFFSLFSSFEAASHEAWMGHTGNACRAKKQSILCSHGLRVRRWQTHLQHKCICLNALILGYFMHFRCRIFCVILKTHEHHSCVSACAHTLNSSRKSLLSSAILRFISSSSLSTGRGGYFLLVLGERANSGTLWSSMRWGKNGVEKKNY